MKPRFTPAATIERAMVLPANAVASPFGCCNFFEPCNDEIMSLHWGGRLPLLDWMGFNVSDVCYRSLYFVPYVRPAMSGITPTAGYIANPCADPNGTEFGSCKLTVEDFGLYGRRGPTRNLFKPEKWCATSQVQRLDGTPVTNEAEWDMRFIMNTILQDVSRHLISGNATTPGQFDGLRRWVKTGYDCEALDSTVINWNHNPMAGGNGITWNGAAVANTFDLVDVLRSAVRRIKQRISWSPMLSNQQLMIGDMILVLPTFKVPCLLDFYTCWSVCEGRQYNEANLSTFEARTFRDKLTATGPANLFGFGYITIEGVTIPLLAYDWDMITGPTSGDIFLLTGAIGNVRLWEGEFLSAQGVIDQLIEQDGGGFFTTDGGRILGKVDVENLCRILKLWMALRLFCKAPWAQIRIQDVRCVDPAGPLSPDPLESSFYIQSSFDPAVCP